MKLVSHGDLQKLGWSLPVRVLAATFIGATLRYSWESKLILDGPTLCLFKIVSGVPCPMCGSTRALAAFFSGDLQAALSLNAPGLMLALLGFVLFLVPEFRIRLFRKLNNVLVQKPVAFWVLTVTAYISIWMTRV